MMSTARGKRTALALLLIAFFFISNQARPSLGATIHRSDQITVERDEMAQKSPTMRRLTWWKWGRGDKKTETTAVAALLTTESSLLHLSPKTTERSRWRSWFSSAKDKFSKTVDKVKTEMKEAKESYDRGMSFVGNAAKEGIVGAGRAIATGAKTVGNATITAGRAIKTGAKKFGSMVKTGFKKIKLKFSGEDEKFKIVANRLKDKLEAGDEKALDLMKKLGINVTYTGNKLSGSHIADKNISVTEILQTEGILSNKSSSYHTAVEQPEESGPASADDNLLDATENDDFHSAEECLDSVNSSTYTTDKAKHFNITPTVYLPELLEISSSTSLPKAMPNKTATHRTQTALPSIAPTITIDTDTSEPSLSSTHNAHISSMSESTPIVPKTAGTRSAKVTDPVTPTSTYEISLSSSLDPYTSESIIIPILISSSPLFTADSSTLTVTSTESTTTFTDITKDETPYPTSTSTDFTSSSYSTQSTDSETELSTETTSITNTSTSLQHISTTQTPSSTSISTSTSTTTYSTSTSPVTTTAETTSTVTPITHTTSTILTTTASTTVSLPVEPSTSLKTTEAASPIETSRAPLSEYEAFPELEGREDEAFPELEGREDEGTLVEAEPYEPPPFPDIFSNTEVHDRLREFYDKGDFSHSEMIEIFNFDPDNYEYYDY